MSKGRIYEYAVIFHPEPAKVDGVEKRAASTIIVDVSRVIAADEKVVALMAAKAIPAEYNDQLDRVEIAIRPF